MTDRLELDRFVTDWLRDDAVARAPERALTGVLERVARTDQDHHLTQRLFGDAVGRSARLRWGLVLAVVAIGFVGAIAFGSVLVRRTALPAAGPTNGWIAYSDSGDISIAREGIAPLRVIGHDGDGIDQTCPVFTGDGASLAYVETPSFPREGDPSNIVVTGRAASGTPDGSALRIPVEASAGCPAWAPDGTRLAIGDLTVIGLDGSRTVRFERDESGPGDSPFGTRQETRFAWSPDGSALALVLGYYPGTSEVWIVPADAGEPRRLVAGRTDLEIFRSIAWSSDGSRIAFWGHTEAAASEGETSPPRTHFVRVMRADGGDPPTEIDTWTEAPDLVSSGPAWSPDGLRLAYVRNGEIVVGSADRSSSRTLPRVMTADHGNASWAPQADGTWWPGALSWSPDGRRVLSLGTDMPFLERGVQSAVVSVDAGGTEAPVVLGPWRLAWYADRTPTWQPVFEGVPAWEASARGVSGPGPLVGRTPDPAATPTPEPVPASQ